MRASIYLHRVVALVVLAAWSVAVNLRERVVTPADDVRSAPPRPSSTHTWTHVSTRADDRFRWN